MSNENFNTLAALAGAGVLWTLFSFIKSCLGG